MAAAMTVAMPASVCGPPRGRWWRRGRTAQQLARAEYGAQGRNPAPDVLALIEEALASAAEKKGNPKAGGRGGAKDKVLPRGYSGVVPPAEQATKTRGQD